MTQWTRIETRLIEQIPDLRGYGVLEVGAQGAAVYLPVIVNPERHAFMPYWRNNKVVAFDAERHAWEWLQRIGRPEHIAREEK